MLFGQQDLAGGFCGGATVFQCGGRLEKIQFGYAGRLSGNHADGLPQADVAIVGHIGVGAAAVCVGIAAQHRYGGDCGII